MEAVNLTVEAGDVSFRVRRYKEALDARRSTLDASRSTLDARRSTPDAQQPLVLFHGFTGASAGWEELALQWALHRTVYAVDLPGHGGTICESDLSWDGHIEALAILVRQFSNGPVHLLGYSMGARLALGLAADDAVQLQSLTLESVHPGLRTDDEKEVRRRQDQVWIDLLAAQSIEAFAAAWESQALWCNQDPLSRQVRLQRAIRREQHPGRLSASLQHVGLAEQPCLEDKLPSLPFPVHLIAGGEDIKFAKLAEEMRRHIPQGCTTLFPGYGHCVHVESPTTYHAITNAFFQDSESAGTLAATGSNNFSSSC